MRLATTLTSMLLVLALAIVGCDGDSGGGTEDDTVEIDPTCEEPCQNKCGMVDECDCGGCETGFTCVEATNTCTPEAGDTCDATCVAKCGMVGECDCGGCTEGNVCVEATHTCAPEAADCNAVCTGKECGTFEGCACGTCAEGETCNAAGACETGGCVPDCAGKQCGPDTCGGSCGLCPCVGCDPTYTVCNEGSGMCEGAMGLDCVGINDCLSGCNPNDTTCQQNCMNSGTVEAQNQYNAVIQCLIDNGAQDCPPGDAAQCQNDIIMEYCMTEYTTCFPGGTMTCSEMFDCMGACADEACLQACYNDSTLDAQSQYQAIASCVIEQCGEQPTEECFQASQQGACAAVFADCYNLGKPEFATGPNGASSKDFVNVKAFMMILDHSKLY